MAKNVSKSSNQNHSLQTIKQTSFDFPLATKGNATADILKGKVGEGTLLKPITELIKVAGSRDKAMQILKEKRIAVVAGMYDHKRLATAFGEPQWLVNKRNSWSLSNEQGLGAVKDVLDPLKLTIVSHEQVGPKTNLTITNAQGKRSRVRLHFRNSVAARSSFTLSSLFGESGINDFDAYLCVCFETHTAWVIPRVEALRAYEILTGRVVIKKMAAVEGLLRPFLVETNEYVTNKGAIQFNARAGDNFKIGTPKNEQVDRSKFGL